MRADWFLAHGLLRCGRCGEPIPAGQPVRRLRFGGHRCAPCATALLGEDVPGDLVPQPTAGPDLHERIDTLRRKFEQPDTQQTIDFDEDRVQHRTEITTQAGADGPCFRVACACGYIGPIVTARRDAEHDEAEHVAGAVRGEG